jgi:hypothetical protein
LFFHYDKESVWRRLSLFCWTFEANACTEARALFFWTTSIASADDLKKKGPRNKKRIIWKGNFCWELITSSKITASKVIKLIKKSVVDHFVEKYLWRATYGFLACYLWRTIYGYLGLWGARLGKVKLG